MSLLENNDKDFMRKLIVLNPVPVMETLVIRLSKKLFIREEIKNGNFEKHQELLRKQHKFQNMSVSKYSSKAGLKCGVSSRTLDSLNSVGSDSKKTSKNKNIITREEEDFIPIKHWNVLYEHYK